MRLGAVSRGRLDYKWRVFGAIAIGMFVSVVDQTGVNLALPLIADHFDATIPTVQWVVLGYILITGSLLLPMGRLSDLIGRKRVYTAGFVVFTAGAVLAGSSTSLLALVLFKSFQGVGAAMVQSTAMAMVTSTFPAGERGKALGLFMTVVGLGAIAGPMVGGAVVGLLGWRYVFLMGVPFGLASIAAALFVLDAGVPAPAERGDRRFRFDWLGAGLSAAALVLFLLVMTNAYRVGWASPLMIVAFVAVASLFVAFVWWEARAPDPMLSLGLFRSALFSLGSSASFLTFLSGTSVFFLMPFYLQKVQGYTPAEAGLIMAPTAVCFALAGPISGRLSDRYGWRKFAVAGLTASGVATFLLTRLSDGSAVGLVLAALAMHGVGMGVFFSPNASAILGTVERSSYGVATAYLNMVRNAANVTGIGLATTIVTATMGSLGYQPSLDAVSSAAAGAGVKAAFSQGLQTTYTVMLGFIVLAVILTAWRTADASREAVPEERDHQLPSKV